MTYLQPLIVAAFEARIGKPWQDRTDADLELLTASFRAELDQLNAKIVDLGGEPC